MARIKLSKAATYLAYSERKLAEATDDDQREFWAAKAAWYRKAIEGRCQRCGRELQDKTATLGPECSRLVGQRVSA